MQLDTKKICSVILALIVLLGLSLPCYADTANSDATLQTILGIGWSELTTCQSDSDCAETGAFDDCCSNIAINKKYFDVVNQKGNALRDAFMTPQKKKICSMAECAPRLSMPSCVHNQCEVTVPVSGSFWQVSGTMADTKVAFDPLFELATYGFSAGGDGTYSLDIRDTAGVVLFTRRFTPQKSFVDNQFGAKEQNGPPVFSELLPVTDRAATIVLMDAQNKELGRVTLGGQPPTVIIASPGAGFTGKGTQTISWAVKGPTVFASKVLYSTDNGASWTEIKNLKDGNSAEIDFDKFNPAPQALIKVLVSDGVNTGAATSVAFAIPERKTSVGIDSPPDHYGQRADDAVYLTGHGYDKTDGTLTGSALAWSSDIQGPLGTGSPLSAKLTPGKHKITLTGTASDGNTASTSVNVVAGGQPPVVNLDVEMLDKAPTTCARATINAKAGSNGADLFKVEYSVDGGKNYINIPMKDLPYSFIAPGSGFIHIVARAFDVSRQSNATDKGFLTASPCPPSGVPAPRR